MADLLLAIRSSLKDVKPKERLALMDVSLGLENILFATIRNWQPDTLEELLEKCRILVRAAAGAGYLEPWELAAVESRQSLPNQETILFELFRLTSEQIRRAVDWGVAMIRSFYQPEIARFSVLEPLAQGFLDDRIRSSILLGLGEAAARLTGIVRADTGQTLQLPAGMTPSGIRGLNPGLAFGILEVVDDPEGPVQTDPEKIYAFKTVPPELKPVAGILTISEGNLVSHVQLLARNLGIPNATVSPQSLEGLTSFSGQRLFFAVSQKGGVVLKTEPEMSQEEKNLVQKQERKQEKFRVPVEKMNLTRAEPVRLSRLRATDSGKLCGPKAANLGELKYLFPDYVGEGIVLPFGIFRQHLDQPMPGESTSYWSFLARALSGDDESHRLAALATLRSAIRTMPFLPGFETSLDELFTTAFGRELGQVAVFIRSDTNMEDIREFTGAGLNLTVFNVRNRDDLLQGIRDVWASPYSERSYLWRQKFLSNPENVFPSVLLLPSVNVDRSGVVITHGLVSDSPGDITAAFSLGAGGAVEGQTAETFLMQAGGEDLLLSPARERTFTRLPSEGGIEKKPASFHRPVLSDADRLKIRGLVNEIRQKLPGTPGIEGDGPFDIEMGFETDRIRLFQVRPFVENRRAGRTSYLLNMDRQHTDPQTLSLKRKL